MPISSDQVQLIDSGPLLVPRLDPAVGSCGRAFTWLYGWAPGRAAGGPDWDCAAGVRPGLGADQRDSAPQLLRDGAVGRASQRYVAR